MGCNGKWGYSTNEERYCGRFDTRESAIAEAMDCGYTTFWVGQYREPTTDQFIEADLILDNTLCQDEYQWDGCDWDFDATAEQKQELTEELRRVFREWMDRHDMRPTFSVVTDAEKIVVGKKGGA